MALDFGNKTANGGSTPQGILSAGEFNQLVAAVNTNMDGIAALGSSKANKTELPLVVNIEESNDVVTCDTSIADIYAAYSADREVVGHMSDDGQVSLFVCTENTIAFYWLFGDAVNYIIGSTNTSDNSDSWTHIIVNIQEKLTFDSKPTASSSNPVKSGGVYTALGDKADKTFKVTITSTTENDVTTYSSDKTVAQILEAYQAGRQVIAVNNNEEYGIYTLSAVTDTGTLFEGTLASGLQMASFEITGNGVTFTVGEAYEKPSSGIPSTDLTNAVQTSLGKADTALQPNYCPIIEDTRSAATDVNITGTAPFDTLAGGQRIVLHFKYANTASPTLQLTLSGGTTTSAYSLYQNYNNGVNALTLQAMPAGSYGEFVFDQTNSRWVLIGKDFNTTYSNTSQSDINSAAQGSRLIEPKLIHDNAYIVSLAYSSGSLKANKMYDFGEVTSALTIPDLDVTNDLVSNAMNFWALHFIVGTLTPAGTTELSITFPQNPSDNTKEIIVDNEPTIKEGDYVEIMITKHTVSNVTEYYASIKVWQAQSQNS